MASRSRGSEVSLCRAGFPAGFMPTARISICSGDGPCGICTSSALVGRYERRRTRTYTCVCVCGRGFGLFVVFASFDQIKSELYFSTAPRGRRGALTLSVKAGHESHTHTPSKPTHALPPSSRAPRCRRGCRRWSMPWASSWGL